MQDRIPATVSPAFFASRKLQGLFALYFMCLGLVSVVPARAGRLVDMPQSRSFTEAYQVALHLAQQQPGSRIMTVASTYSMYPTIDWDSIVVIVPTALDQLKVGDVVCYRDQRLDGQHTILHRVERILPRDRRLITHGDNLDRADPHPVGADALIGKAVYVVYFDRQGEKRPGEKTLPTPDRKEQVVRL